MEKFPFGNCNGNEHNGKSALRICRIIGVTIAGVALAVLMAFLFGFLVKILWNSLMPAIFGLPAITYWQAFGLIILAKLLFGSFGHHHDHKKHSDHIHHKVEDKWHRWLGVNGCSGTDKDLLKPKVSHKNWKYYEKFWREEGKDAFESYIDRIEAEKSTEKGERDDEPGSNIIDK